MGMVLLDQTSPGIEEAESAFVRLTLLGGVSTVGFFVRACSDEPSARLVHVPAYQFSRWNSLWHSLLFPKAETCIRSVSRSQSLIDVQLGLKKEPRSLVTELRQTCAKALATQVANEANLFDQQASAPTHAERLPLSLQRRVEE